MTCAEVSELIGPYLDDDLPAEARRRLEKHLLTCRDCAWEVQTLQLLRENLRSENDAIFASDAFRARTLNLLRADNPHLTQSETVAEEPLQYQLPIPL